MHMREQRRFERIPFIRNGRLAVVPDGASLEVSTIDLSQGGLGLFCSRFMERGVPVQVSLQIGDDQGDTLIETVKATVAFGRVEMEGNYLGIEFSYPISQVSHPALWDVLQTALKRTTRADS